MMTRRKKATRPMAGLFLALSLPGILFLASWAMPVQAADESSGEDLNQALERAKADPEGFIQSKAEENRARREAAGSVTTRPSGGEAAVAAPPGVRPVAPSPSERSSSISQEEINRRKALRDEARRRALERRAKESGAGQPIPPPPPDEPTAEPEKDAAPSGQNGVGDGAQSLPDVHEEELKRLADLAKASTQPAESATTQPAESAATQPADVAMENASGPVPTGDDVEEGVSVDPKTGKVTLKPKTYFRIPAEERPYFFTWNNTPFEKACQDFVEMSGLSMIGLELVTDADKKKTITFQSVQLMNYDEALLQFDQLLMEIGLGYWILQRDEYLEIRALSEWYRRMDPDQIYTSFEPYRAAKLPVWELASVVWEPKNVSPAVLAAAANDKTPDNAARATVASSANKVQIEGFVYYIERQIQVMEKFDERPDDGRVWQIYPLKWVSPGEASSQLQGMLPDDAVPEAPASPTPAPSRSRSSRTPSATPTPPSPVTVGSSSSDDVTIQEQTDSSRLLIKASPAKHEIIADLLAKYIDVQPENQHKTELIRLEHADPTRMVEVVKPLLGQQRLVQRPAPAAKPNQPPPPPPPPQVMQVGTTAVLTPLPEQKSIMVKATEAEMQLIRDYVKQLDVPVEQAKYEYVRLEHASATSLATVLTNALGAVQRYRAPRTDTTVFKAVADTTSDKGLVLSGEPDDMAAAKQLLAELDVDPESGAVQHLVHMENAKPSTVSQILSTRFGSGTTSYSRYSRMPSSSGSLPQFIPDDASKTLIVTCHEGMWDDINGLIMQLDENSKVDTTTRTYRLQHVSAATVSSFLSQALGGSASGGYSYRSYYGSTAAADEPKFSYDPQTNLLLVTATDEDHTLAEAMIKQLDQPGPADAVDFRPIELANADAQYVASKIEELFGSSRSPYGYSSRGGPIEIPVRVVAEPVSNRVLVSASESDFEKARQVAEEIDKRYSEENYERRIFVLKNAEVFDVQQAIQTMFSESSGGSRYSLRSSASMPGGVKMAPTGQALVVLAPKKKMEQIASLIAELDADVTKDNELKIYKVKGTDYYGTSQIARNLEQIFSGGGGRNYHSSQQAEVRFFGEYGSDLLFVSAPKDRMPEIDAKVNEILEAKDVNDLTMAIRHFGVSEARPQDVADMIEPILQTKYQELQQQSGGRSRYYGYSGSSGPTVTVEKTTRRIMVMAPETLMPLVEELIGEFDQPSKPTTTRYISLKKAQAADIAPIVEQHIADSSSSSGSSRHSRSSRSRFGYSPYSSWYGSYGSSSSREPDELLVTPIESSNMIVLRGPEDKVAEAESFIARLDEESRPEGPILKVYQLEHADLWDVMTLLDSVVQSGATSSLSGRSSGGSAITINADYASNQLIVAAPAEKLPLIEEAIAIREDLARAKTTSAVAEGGGKGTPLGPPDKYGSITKLYDVQGPAKEIADRLDKILYAMVGYSAPYVKSFPYGNRIVITGDPQYFKLAEEELEKIEKDPPLPKMKLRVLRTADPMKVLNQWRQFAPGSVSGTVNITEVRHTGRGGDPLTVIEEIGAFDPIESSSGRSSSAPFVPPNALSDLARAVSKAVLAQPVDVRAVNPSTQPASGTATPAPKPTAADKPTAPAQPAATAQPGAAAKPANSGQETINQVIGAAQEARATNQAQILYDAKEGLILIVGQESQVDEIEELMDLIARELEEVDEGGRTDIRVFRMQYVDVSVAASILEEMFNENAKKQQAAKAKQPKPAKPKTADEKGKPGEEDEESAAAKRRREEEEAAAKEEEAAAQAAAAARSIRVVPDPRTNTLIVRAAPELFPDVAELLLKIDRPGTRLPTQIKIFQLERLNAYEVEQVLKEVLKIDGASTRTRTRTTGRRGAGSTQADMIEQLTQQMLELEAAAAQAGAEQDEGKGGKLSINPAKDIGITSDATTNSIIVSAPEEGMVLVESLIRQLEEQEIPIRIQTVELQNAEASKVAAELEKVFESSRRSGGRGGDGITPSRMGDVKISADERTNKLVIRALDPDIEKILPIIEELDAAPVQSLVQLYPLEHADAAGLVKTLTAIFQETGRSDSQATRITADDATNSILVRAGDAQQQLIAAKIKELDQYAGTERKPRKIQLVQASATNVAAKLQEIFIGKGAAARVMRDRISISGDDTSKTLFVISPPEMFEEIKSVAEMMDQITEHSIKVFKLKNASATEVLNRFKEMTGQLMKQLGRGSLDVFSATADERTNSLIVAGTPMTFIAIQTVLDELDAAPSDRTDVKTQMFTLLRGSAVSVASTINALYGGKRWHGGVEAPKAAAEASANVVYVTGSQSQIDHIKASVIDPLQGIPVDAAAVTISDYQINVEHADVEELSIKLNSLFSQRLTARKNAGDTTVSASDMALSIMAEPATKKLFISCSENTKTLMDEWIKTLDVEEATNQGQKTEVIPVRYANLTYTVQALQGAFKQRGRVSPSEEITISAEYGTNSVIVKAPSQAMEQIKELLAEIDRDDANKITPPVTVEIRHVRASQLAATLNQMISRTKRRDARTGTYPVTITADDNANALLISATSPQDMDELQGLIAKLDTQPAEDVRTIKPYVLKFADLASTRTIILKRFSGQEQLPVRDQVLVEYDYATSALLVTASEENQAKVAKIVEDVDDSTIIDIPLPETIKVKNVRASQLAATLNQMISRTKRRDRRTGTYPVTVNYNDTANTLLVTANKADMEEMKGIIADLDVLPEQDERTVKPYVLKFADLSTTAKMILKRFTGQEELPLGDQVLIDYDYQTSALLVTASEENHAKVAKIVEDVDDATIIDEPLPETIKVKNVRASQLAGTLNQMISRTKRRDRRTGTYPVTVNYNDTANTLLVTANKADMEEMKQIIADLDVPPEQDERTVKPYVLKFADLSTTAKMILKRFTGQEELPIGDQVLIDYDYQTSALLVTASEENHAKVAKIVEDVDDATIIDEPLPQAVTVNHILPSRLAVTLNQMISRTKRRDRRTGTYPVTVTADDTAGTLLVTANRADMEEMKRIIAELDTQPAEDERIVKPYVLKFADLGSAQKIILKRFSDQQDRPVREQVAVEPDYATGALVVTASEVNHEEVSRIIADLDDSDIVAIRAPKTIKVENVLASELAKTLNDMIKTSKRRDRRTGTYPVTVSYNDSTNTLLVTANPTDMEEMEALIATLDVPVDMDDERTIKPYFLRFADTRAVVNIITSRFKDNKSLSVREQVEAVAEASTSAVVVTASEENHAKVEALIEELDQSEMAGRQTYTITLSQATPEDLSRSLTTVFNSVVPRRSGRMAPVFTAATGTRKMLVTCTPSEIEEIRAIVADLDKVDSELENRTMEVVSVTHVAPREMASILTEYLSKPGQRSGSALLDDIKVAYSDSASAVILTGSPERLAELRELVEKVDDSAPDEGGREIRVFALTNANPSSVASMISRTYTKRGTMAEADRVDASAETGTNSVVVTATPDKLEKIAEMIGDLDTNSANIPQQKILRLEHARAEDLTDVLTQTYRSGRRGSAGPPISFAADPNGNAIIVSAGQADLDGIEAMVKNLDVPATDRVEELRVIPLQYVDADETLEIMSEYLRKPGGRRSSRSSSGDLIGDIRLQSSATLNALIVSGSPDEIDRIQEIVLKMDHEIEGAGAPKVIKVEHTTAAQLAITLTKIFTDPAQKTKGRTNPEMVPLIMADEATNSLVIRARANDFRLIQDMARQLDAESEGPTGLKVVAVPRGVDVVSLSRQIESTINKGETLKRSMQPGYIPRQVAIGGDERTSTLIVAGSPDMFQTVQDLVDELESNKPVGGGPGVHVVPVKTLPARDVQRFLEQFIQQQQGRRR